MRILATKFDSQMTLRHTCRPSIEEIIMDEVILFEQARQLKRRQTYVRVVVLNF